MTDITPERRYTCLVTVGDRGCGLVFGSSEALQAHEKTHATPTSNDRLRTLRKTVEYFAYRFQREGGASGETIKELFEAAAVLQALEDGHETSALQNSAPSAAENRTSNRYCRSMPPVGDRGQRYEVRFTEDGEEKVLGWSEKYPQPLIDAVEAHPSWHSPRVIDRRPE